MIAFTDFKRNQLYLFNSKLYIGLLFRGIVQHLKTKNKQKKPNEVHYSESENRW